MNTQTQDTEPSGDDQLKLIESHVARLAEHFDTVQVFCTYHNREGTRSFQRGEGNWFARAGQVQEWVTTRDESARINERRNNE